MRREFEPKKLGKFTTAFGSLVLAGSALSIAACGGDKTAPSEVPADTSIPPMPRVEQTSTPLPSTQTPVITEKLTPSPERQLEETGTLKLTEDFLLNVLSWNEKQSERPGFKTVEIGAFVQNIGQNPNELERVGIPGIGNLSNQFYLHRIFIDSEEGFDYSLRTICEDCYIMAHGGLLPPNFGMRVTLSAEVAQNVDKYYLVTKRTEYYDPQFQGQIVQRDSVVPPERVGEVYKAMMETVNPTSAVIEIPKLARFSFVGEVINEEARRFTSRVGETGTWQYIALDVENLSGYDLNSEEAFDIFVFLPSLEVEVASLPYFLDFEHDRVDLPRPVIPPGFKERVYYPVGYKDTENPEGYRASSSLYSVKFFDLKGAIILIMSREGADSWTGWKIE